MVPTGDQNNIGILIVLAVLCVIVVVALLFMGKGKVSDEVSSKEFDVNSDGEMEPEEEGEQTQEIIDPREDETVKEDESFSDE